LFSTKPILDAVEAVGKKHGGIQHWGMFYSMSASGVTRAFPDLAKWRSVHFQLTNGGRVRTFENDFSVRSGLREFRTNIALTGGAGWQTTPVALSNGHGTFTVTNQPVANFAGWGQTANVVAHAMRLA
jgi:hypothetical protein